MCFLCTVQSKLAVMSGNFKSILEVRTEVNYSYCKLVAVRFFFIFTCSCAVVCA